MTPQKVETRSTAFEADPQIAVSIDLCTKVITCE